MTLPELFAVAPTLSIKSGANLQMNRQSMPIFLPLLPTDASNASGGSGSVISILFQTRTYSIKVKCITHVYNSFPPSLFQFLGQRFCTWQKFLCKSCAPMLELGS